MDNFGHILKTHVAYECGMQAHISGQGRGVRQRHFIKLRGKDILKNEISLHKIAAIYTEKLHLQPLYFTVALFAS